MSVVGLGASWGVGLADLWRFLPDPSTGALSLLFPIPHLIPFCQPGAQTDPVGRTGCWMGPMRCHPLCPVPRGNGACVLSLAWKPRLPGKPSGSNPAPGASPGAFSRPWTQLRLFRQKKFPREITARRTLTPLHITACSRLAVHVSHALGDRWPQAPWGLPPAWVVSGAAR